MHESLRQLFEWYGQFLESHGYLAVALLMAMESTVFPLPSELIIPPAVILAQRSGSLSLTGIVIAGAVGSWAGATAMYWVSRWAGRPLIMRYGKYVMIPPAKVEKAERWANQFGNFGVFASRLLPVVRHLIGIPAGIVRLNFLKYSIYTFLGSALWCTVLCFVGVKAGNDQEFMAGELHRVLLWVVGALVVLGVIYYFLVHRFTREKKTGTA